VHPRADSARPIDREQAQRHLALLDPAAECFLFAGFPDPVNLKGPAAHQLGRLDDVLVELEAWQAHGYGVFVTVNATQGARRRRQDVARVRAIWAERDEPGRALPLRPSLRIRTSQGRGHEYLLCDAHVPPSLGEGEQTNGLIASDYGGDGQACDVARVLRLARSSESKMEHTRPRTFAR
jgi:hypothetical protein